MSDIFERTYVASMFDYDGTLIERGYRMPLPDYMPALLREISQKSYMAICTARPFPAAFKHAHDILGDQFEDLKRKWVWICENGGAGYRYDEDAGDFKEFYRIAWPDAEVSYMHFQKLVTERFGDIVHEIDFHDSVTILRPKDLPILSTEAISESCRMLEKMGLEFLREYHFDEHIRLGNSNLGVIFYGKNADKDQGIFEFGTYLSSLGIPLSEPFYEIICFGDNPGPHGNDEHFLSGRYGTPVNVGDEISNRPNLFSVFDESGSRLIGPTATAYLLRRLHFS